MNTLDLKKTIKITALNDFLFCFGTYVHIFAICLVLIYCGFWDRHVTIVNEHSANQVQPNPRQLQFDDFVIKLLVKTQFRVKELEEENKSISTSLLNVLKTDAMVSYTLLEPQSSPDYPLLGELISITCNIVRDENDTRPVHADIFMPAKSRNAALKIQYACRETIEQVYRNASQLGPIPSELVDAFTVELNDNEITIHIALPDEMAKYLFAQFFSALQGNDSSSEQQILRNEPKRPLIDDIPDPTPTLELPPTD